MKDEEYKKLRAARKAFHVDAIKIPGVHGTSIGVKRVGNKLTDIIALCVHVEKKRPPGEVPEAERIPSTIDGFPTDVIEQSLPSACADGTKYRPVLSGCEIVAGPMPEGVNYSTGTLGAFVRDSITGEVMALSNQHVMQAPGWLVGQPKGDACNKMGTVVRSVHSNVVDAAVCTLEFIEESPRYIAEIIGIGPMGGTYTVGANDLPYRVMKTGYTSGLTQGEIVNIHWQGRNTSDWYFEDQLLIQGSIDATFMEPGDSGSALIGIPGGNNPIVGLLWGTQQVFNEGAACPIDAVLQQLAVTHVTQMDPEEDSVPFEETTFGKLEALLSQSRRGQAYLDSINRHRSVIFHLFHDVPRLHAIWKRIPQTEMMLAIRGAIDDPDSEIPVDLGLEKTVEVLAKLRNGLSRYVDDDLLKQIDLLCRDISENLGSSWRQALRDA